MPKKYEQRKSVYLDLDLVEVVQEEAKRRNITVSRVIQDCIRLVITQKHRLEPDPKILAFEGRIGVEYEPPEAV